MKVAKDRVEGCEGSLQRQLIRTFEGSFAPLSMTIGGGFLQGNYLG